VISAHRQPREDADRQAARTGSEPELPGFYAALRMADMDANSSREGMFPYVFLPETSSFRTHTRNRSSHATMPTESSVKTHHATSSD
jgi:hypothetical protein